MALNINQTIRTTRRYAEVIGVLARHGFAEFVTETGLDLLYERGRRLMPGYRAEEPSEKLALKVRLRKVLEELGPTFIKLGQILSTRPDLIPVDIAEEFKRLQTDCPRVPYPIIRQRLEEEFGASLETIFASIEEEPLAAASMAQAHRAVLCSGERVVLKILRPGIEEVIASDMSVLREIASFADSHLSGVGFSPTRVVQEFSRQLGKEVNLAQEGRNTDRLRSLFAGDEHVAFPAVYWQATTRRVLTIELIEGTQLSSPKAFELPVEERRRIVAHGADAVFRQCLEFGFFHADPHPGNLFALAEGRICFIDCGMTGRVEERITQRLADLVIGVVQGDLDRVIHATIALTDADPNLARDSAFRQEALEFIGRFSLGTLEGLDMADMLGAFFKLLRDYGIECPGNLVFLIKALTTIQGVGQELAPDFDLVGHIRPHIEQLVSRRYGFKALRRRMRDAMGDYLTVIEHLPHELMAIAANFRRSDFSIALEHRGFDRLTETIEHASRNIAMALVVLATLVGSSILMLADRMPAQWGVLSWIGFPGLALGLLMAGVLGLGSLRRGTGRRRRGS